MKTVLTLLVAGTVVSGLAAAYAATTRAPVQIAAVNLDPVPAAAAAPVEPTGLAGRN